MIFVLDGVSSLKHTVGGPLSFQLRVQSNLAMLFGVSRSPSIRVRPCQSAHNKFFYMEGIIVSSANETPQRLAPSCIPMSIPFEKCVANVF